MFYQLGDDIRVTNDRLLVLTVLFTILMLRVLFLLESDGDSAEESFS